MVVSGPHMHIYTCAHTCAPPQTCICTHVLTSPRTNMSVHTHTNQLASWSLTMTKLQFPVPACVPPPDKYVHMLSYMCCFLCALPALQQPSVVLASLFQLPRPRVPVTEPVKRPLVMESFQHSPALPSYSLCISWKFRCPCLSVPQQVEVPFVLDHCNTF